MHRHRSTDPTLWLFAAALCIGWAAALPAGSGDSVAAAAASDPGQRPSTAALPAQLRVRVAAPAAPGGESSPGAAAPGGSPAFATAVVRGEGVRLPDGEYPRRPFFDRVSYRTTGPPARTG